MKNLVDKDTLASELDKLRLSNDNINSWGDGFEYCIEKVYEIINKLKVTKK